MVLGQGLDPEPSFFYCNCLDGRGKYLDGYGKWRAPKDDISEGNNLLFSCPVHAPPLLPKGNAQECKFQCTLQNVSGMHDGGEADTPWDCVQDFRELSLYRRYQCE
jgi:hypothetical protein